MRFNQGNDYALTAPVSSTGTTTFQADTLIGNTTGKGLAVSNSINLNGGTFQVGSPNIANNAIGKLTIETGANITAGNLFLGEQSLKQGLVDQTDGAVTVSAQFRVGHWPNETSTYNLNGGTFNLTAPTAAAPFGTGEQNGGVYLGIDGTGILNHSGGTLSTDFIVLDNRGNTVAGTNRSMAYPDGALPSVAFVAARLRFAATRPRRGSGSRHRSRSNPAG